MDVQFKSAKFTSRNDRLHTGASTVTRTTDLLLAKGNSDVAVQESIARTMCSRSALATPIREEPLLEEAVNDGTAVKTAGTLVFTCIEVT